LTYMMSRVKCSLKEVKMKTIRLFVALAFAFFISSPCIAADGDYAASVKARSAPSGLISMDFQDANLKDLLKIFSQQSGLNFVASQNVQDRTATIYFDNVTVEDALNHIMNANNLVYEQESGSEIFIVKESGKPAIETLTKIYELKYAQLVQPSSDEEDAEEEEAEIISVVQNILSEEGKLVADKRSNSLIIKDVPSQFAIIEDVLARLDVKAQQVMIEVEIIETTTTVADKLGVVWGSSTGTMAEYTGPTANTVWPLRGRFSKDTDVGEGLTTGTFSLTNLTATIKAILSDKDTKVLARPRVLTLNNETAEININSNDAIQSNTEWTYPETGPTTSTTTFERAAENERPGVSLKVTPTISKVGFVTMTIEPKLITKALSDLATTTDAIYDLSFRTAQVKVMVSDGETVVIGGLISKDKEESIRKIPFLGDIPLLGAAFRYKAKDEADRELLIFITPHIVKEAAYALGDISEREQEKPKAIREKKIRNMLDLLGG